jgi:hypothetical protein
MNNIELYETQNPDEKIYVSCGTIHERFKEYVIQTTHKEVIDSINSFKNETNEVNKRVFKNIYTSIVQYDKNKLHQLYLNKDEDWNNFCNDVLLFYTCRFVLFGEKMYIPILDRNNIKHIQF